MEEVTYSIELSDGTMLNNLRLNGNNYVSETEVTEAEFAGRISRVIIRSSDTEEILNDAELLQIVHYSDGWYFILREIPEAEQMQMDMDALTVDQELRITMLELGLEDF